MVKKLKLILKNKIKNIMNIFNLIYKNLINKNNLKYFHLIKIKLI